MISNQQHGPNADRAAGIAYLIDGRANLAIERFERMTPRTAADWNNLAAANICAARATADPERWLEALAAVDAALAIDPVSSEALFNRAVVVDALGIAPLSRATWKRYLELDSASRWSRVARQRLAAVGPSDTETWKAATAALTSLDAQQLMQLTESYPQPARRYADAVYLPAWAAAIRSKDLFAATKQLAAVRVIARALRRQGDGLLADAVGSIDSADAGDLPVLVAGHLSYLDGRVALFHSKAAEAEVHLRRAARHFQDAGSPMTLVADFWIACALTERHQSNAALQVLRSLSGQLSLASDYRALAGHVQYQIAVIEAMRGNWSASLDAAQRSAGLFAMVRERGNRANADAVLAEDLDLLGQSALASSHAFAALRDSAGDGAFDRTRVVLAVLCRSQLRVGQWRRARALTTLEGQLARVTADARLNPDMFVRRAVADARNGSADEARYWMHLARSSAGRIPDPEVRGKLLADIDAAHGTLERAMEPRRAIPLLSAAIAFQLRAARPIVLPELYLERARAFIALNDLGAGERDYESGIKELERQRGHVFDAELRPGVFDHAYALFDGAIALQLQYGRPIERVWRYVQRGRARAVLDQIRERSESFTTPILPDIRDVQRALPERTALLEYVSLPDRLLAFVVTNDRSRMHTIPLRRDVLSQMANELVERRGLRSAALYDAIVAPLREDLGGVEALNIVCDDILQRVPFSGLFDVKSRAFLIQRYRLAGSPSAAVLLETLSRAPERQVVPSIAIFANPTVPPDEFGDLPSLTAAEHEARVIGALYERDTTYMREGATAERFCDLAPLHTVVHFAGHGIIRKREPLASALVCAVTPHRRGGVTMRDIARLRFRNTRVMVLAACSTMGGRNAAREGVPSLARAFVIAGVPNVVGTLWDIKDSEAIVITRPLHQRLARGVAVANALRLAQLDAIHRGVGVEKWSSFALLGTAAAETQTVE